MPLCAICGMGVDVRAPFCQKCGAPQSGGLSFLQPGRKSQTDLIFGLRPIVASRLCYLPWLGWIMSILILSTYRFRGHGLLRFHAFQGLYLFVSWLIVELTLGSILEGPGSARFIVPVLDIFFVVVWLYLLVRVGSTEPVRLPLLGDLAARSVDEQGASGRV